MLANLGYTVQFKHMRVPNGWYALPSIFSMSWNVPPEYDVIGDKFFSPYLHCLLKSSTEFHYYIMQTMRISGSQEEVRPPRIKMLQHSVAAESPDLNADSGINIASKSSSTSVSFGEY